MPERVSMFTDSYPERQSVRAILFDTTGELLFHAVQNPGQAPFITTFGGGIEAGESPVDTLTRELHEELDAEAVVGRHLISLLGHSFYIARVTRLGDQPFTHGPEFAAVTGQKFWVARTSYEGATHEDFSLQPRHLQSFLVDYKTVILTELERITPGAAVVNNFEGTGK